MPRSRRMTRAAALAALAVVPCNGAGMNTHTMVGQRVFKHYGKVTTSPHADKYNDAIQSNINAVHGGADFPDFLYACGSYSNAHDAGEMSHWPPWQAAAANHIRARPDFQSGQWSESTKKLIAFLYGVSTHYMTDEIWEGLTGELGRGQGFVRFLSSFNLGHFGDNGNDESVANMATDFFVSWAMDESGIEPWKRDFPIQDIAEIYHEYHYNGKDFSNVTVASLVECELLFNLGLWAEKVFGQFLFHFYSERMNSVPMVAERVLDIPMSGIDDLAVWTSWVWERVARWLDDGPPADPSPRLSSTLESGPEKIDEADVWLREFVQSLEALRPFAAELLAHKAEDLLSFADAADPFAGLTYHGPSQLRGPVEALLRRFVRYAGHAAGHASDSRTAQALRVVRIASAPPVVSANVGGHEPIHTSDGESDVAYHGSSMASGDFDGDGVADLAVGAYGSGIAGDPQRGLVSVDYASGLSGRLSGPMAHARFGWELVSLDFNQDGVDDLAVSAPTASWDDALPLSDDEPYHRFWGRVYIFFGKKGEGLSTEPGVVVTTSDELTGLGMTMSTGDLDGDGNRDLLVGAPMSSFRANASWSDHESIQRGALFGFISRPARQAAISPLVLDARAESDLRLEGESGYEWFGQSAVVLDAQSPRLLVVGAPASRSDATTVGRAYVYELDAKGTGQLALTITGDEPLAEFGHSLAVQGGVTLAVSSPAAGTSGPQRRGGEVRLVQAQELVARANPSSPPNVQVADLATQALLVGGNHGGTYGRLGWNVAFADVTGDLVEDLVVGAPLSNSGLLASQRETGKLFVWDGSSLPTGTVKNLQRSCSFHTAGTRARARMGSAFVAVPVTGGGKALAVGSPRADAGGEMRGVVDQIVVASTQADIHV